MYICVCGQVSDREWSAALEAARTRGQGWHEAAEQVGAGVNCGSCRVELAATAANVLGRRPLGLTILEAVAEAG